MNVTTSYGTWCNHGDSTNVSVEATIADAINGGDSEWRDRMETSGALERVASDYRDAIDNALPDGISIAGNEFIGLHRTDPDYTDEIGDFDISEAIQGVDLFAIVQKHDVDN
ncbi:hypothetical protein [Streptomyces sp. NPDC088258]|uniref:hypothetical protein n=1 Tax=Streptomyces sp. NPDC088258 TaxID=3365849 RepID=UPI00382FFAC4